MGELFLRDLLYSSPSLFAGWMVVIFIGRSSPPDSILGVFIHDNEFVLRRASGENTGHDINRIEFGELPDIKAFQPGLCFLFKQEFVGGVMNDFSCAENAIFC